MAWRYISLICRRRCQKAMIERSTGHAITIKMMRNINSNKDILYSFDGCYAVVYAIIMPKGLDALAPNGGDEDVEEDGPGQSGYPLGYNKQDGGQDYDIAAEILAPLKVFKLQRKHPHPAQHQ